MIGFTVLLPNLVDQSHQAAAPGPPIGSALPRPLAVASRHHLDDDDRATIAGQAAHTGASTRNGRTVTAPRHRLDRIGGEHRGDRGGRRHVM